MNTTEIVVNALWNDCLKISVVNLATGELSNVKTLDGEDAVAATAALPARLQLIADLGIIHPDDLSGYYGRMCMLARECLASARPVRFSHKLRYRIGGEFVWVSLDMLCPDIPSGDPLAVLCIRRMPERRLDLEDALLPFSNTYHKILRVRLDDETFEAVKSMPDERGGVPAKEGRISLWLRNFAITERVHPDDLETYLRFADFEAIRAGFLGAPGTRPTDILRCRYRRRTGDEFRWVVMILVRAVDFSPENPVVMLYVKDIHDFYSEDMDRMDRLLHEQDYDDLTGLKNRRRLDRDIMALQDMPDPPATGVIFADLNGLKRINDTRGHAAGDDFIIGFARRLSRTFGADVCYHLSGDEFVVLLKGVGEEDFRRRAKEFHAAIRAEETPPASVGAAWRMSPSSFAALEREAEERMYEDKAECHRLHPETIRTGDAA